MSNFEIDGLELDFSREPFSDSANSPFFIEKASSHAKVLSRLLLGGCYLTGSIGEAHQGLNYFVVGAPRTSGTVALNLMRAFGDLGEERGGRFFKGRAVKPICDHLNSQRVNHALFHQLLSEIAKSMLNQRLGRHLAAFVHSYRAIENLSYAFPLFYCRYSKEYSKVYAQLREFFKGGELDFCSNFYSRLICDDGLEQSQSSIEFEGVYQSEFAKHLTSQINWTVDKKGTKALVEISPNVIGLRLRDNFDLIVNIRNSYFHHLSGSSKNSSSKDIKDPDSFFKPINELSYQTIGYLVNKIIKVQI